MNTHSKKLYSLFYFVLVFAGVRAQQNDSLKIVFNKYQLLPGDTLSIFASYSLPGKKLPPATLQMIIEHESGKSTKMRWPMLNGYVMGDIALPDSLPKGKYNISFAVQSKFFRIYGKVNPPVRTNELNTMLLTSKGEWLTEDIPVAEDGSFTIKGWLFEKDATLVFSRKKKVSSDLDISINTWLDSSYQPLAIAAREFYFGEKPTAVSIDTNGTRIKPDIDKFSEKVNLLPGVVITGKLKTKAEKFNETYSTGMFKSMDEKLFDFMSDPSAASYNSVMDYLQGRVAGLQITRNADGTSSGKWRGGGMSFYIDELRVDADQVSSLNMSDIAIVKVYPPPFFGNSGGNGGAVAIYTKRGEYDEQKGDRHIFKIKGYSPLQTNLGFQKFKIVIV